MKNFIFISPNFPTNYWMFCRELKNNGLNVLGIGDMPYDNLPQHLKDSLNEYYKVGSLENYDEVFKAVAFFSFKYGHIDYLESNNEYWLEKDAQLRTDFNIDGFKSEDMKRVKFKSKMKHYYQKAGIPVARYYMVKTLLGAQRFIKTVGYPVIAKPDNGVGANATYKLKNDEDLARFFERKDPSVQYIMEEFVNGTVCSYDAIIDSTGTPIFETGNVTLISPVDTVEQMGECSFYIRKDDPEDIIDYGRRTVESFGVKSRFIHFEFFRLNQDQEGLGKKGELVALEVNMRPSGGITPDMHNYANSTNVYKLFADMITYDKLTLDLNQPHYNACFAGRRDGVTYKMSEEEIMAKYGSALKQWGRVDEALSDDMGNTFYLATIDNDKIDEYYKDVLGK